MKADYVHKDSRTLEEKPQVFTRWIDTTIEELKHQNQKYKEVIDKATNELFILKDMIYKPETREENFEIQRKISSIIKRLNGKEVE